jgi:hypothetical protein
MQIVRAMAGFSYGQADLFRRAISHKQADKLAALKDQFIDGCLKNGKDRSTAEKVYALIFKFADYGFNKSHAVSYAVLTCQMAYLKKHFPKEFYCAILDSMSPSRPQIQRHDERDQIDRPLPFRPRREPERIRLRGRWFLAPLPPFGDQVASEFAHPFAFGRTGRKGPFKDLFAFAGRMKNMGFHSLL